MSERIDCAALAVCPCRHPLSWWQRWFGGHLLKCHWCYCYRILGDWRKPFYSEVLQ
jgi:hypothetical protein